MTDLFGCFYGVGNHPTRMFQSAKLLSVDEQPSPGGESLLSYVVDVRFRVTIGLPTDMGSYNHCQRCGAKPPLPEPTLEQALYFLAFADNQRLVFPRAEGAKAERDQYIVKGWTQSHNGEGDAGMLCPPCSALLALFMRSGKPKP